MSEIRISRVRGVSVRGRGEKSVGLNESGCTTVRAAKAEDGVLSQAIDGEDDGEDVCTREGEEQHTDARTKALLP